MMPRSSTPLRGVAFTRGCWTNSLGSTRESGKKGQPRQAPFRAAGTRLERAPNGHRYAVPCARPGILAPAAQARALWLRRRAGAGTSQAAAVDDDRSAVPSRDDVVDQSPARCTHPVSRTVEGDEEDRRG